MTKTKTNRVRASVRKTPKTLRELNTGKMNKVMSKFIPARYDLVVEFALTGDQDLNDPVDFLPNNLSRLEMGSGYSKMTLS